MCMRKIFFALSLVLSLTACGEKSNPTEGKRLAQAQEPATANTSNHRWQDRALIVPEIGQSADGQPILLTTIVVSGYPVPGASESMKMPTIGGQFHGRYLVKEELLVCDQSAEDVELSCVPVPKASRPQVVSILERIFEERAEETWKNYMDQLDISVVPDEENSPEQDLSYGIMNTT